MANTVDYIIRLLPDTSAIKNKIKAGDLLNTSDISDIKNLIIDEVRKATAAISKEGPKMQKALQEGLSVDTSEMEKRLAFIAGLMGDLEKIKNPMEDWTKRGKGVYDTFTNLQNTVSTLRTTVAGLQDSMDTLTSSFETFKNSYQSFRPTEFASVTKEAKETASAVIELDKLFTNLGKNTSGIDKTQRSLEGYKKILSSITGKKYTLSFDISPEVIDESFQYVNEDIEMARDEIDRIQEKLTQKPKDSGLIEQLKTQQLELAKLLIQLNDIENARLKMSKTPILGVEDETSAKELQREVKTILKEFKDDTKKITESLSKIKLDLTLPEYQSFIPKINKFVDDLNTNSESFNKIKLTPTIIDEAANPIEDKSKRAYKSKKEFRAAQQDVVTSSLLEKTGKRFARLEDVIGKKQESILKRTKDWRIKMLEALQFKSEDLKFTWDGDVTDNLGNLYNTVQNYFDENEIEIKINAEDIAQQLQAEIQKKGITLGTGGAIDTNAINQLVQALVSQGGLQLAVSDGGIPVTNTGVSNVVDTQDEKDADEAVETAKTYVKELSKSTIHIDKVVEALKEFADKSGKSKGAKQVSDYFTKVLGIDIKRIKDREKNKITDDDIIQMLQNGLMRDDGTGHALGGKLDDYLLNRILNDKKLNLSADKGSGKLINQLGLAIQEMFKMANVKTEREDENITRRDWVEEFKKFLPYGRANDALNRVRTTFKNDNPKGQLKIPSLEEIDIAIERIKAVNGDTSAFEAFKKAREELGDLKDDASIAKFKQAALDFYNSSKDLFQYLSRNWHNFQGQVQIQGRKAPITVKNPGSTNPKYIPEDAIISNVIPYFVDGVEVNKKPKPTPNPSKQDIKVGKFKPLEVNKVPRNINTDAELKVINSIPKLEKEIQENDQKLQDLTETINRLETETKTFENFEVKTPSTKRFTVAKNQVANLQDIVNNVKNALETNSTIDKFNGLDLTDNQFNTITELKDTLSNIKGHKEKLDQIDKAIEKNLSEQSLLKSGKINDELRLLEDKTYANKILGNFDIMRQSTELPKQYDTSRLIDLLQKEGLDTKSVDDLQKFITQYDHNQDKDGKQLEAALEQFVENSQSVFEQLKQRYGSVGTKEWEQRNRYRNIIKNPDFLKNELSSLDSDKRSTKKETDSYRTKAQSLISKLDAETNSVDNEANALAIALRESREKLYKEAKEYVKVLENSNSDDAAKNTARVKLEQTLKGLSHITKSFALVEKLVNVPLYDTKSHLTNVNKWTKTYGKETTTLDGMRSDLLNRQEEKEQLEKRKKFAESELKSAQNRVEESSAATVALSFLEQYTVLLEQEKDLMNKIATAKNKGKSHKSNDAKLKKVQDKIEALLRSSDSTERHAYGLDAAVEYHNQLANANRTLNVNKNDLEWIEKQETALNKGDFNDKSVRRGFNAYKRYLKNKLYEAEEAEIKARYSQWDKNTIPEDKRLERNNLLEEAKQKTREYYSQLFVENGQLIRKYSVKDDKGVTQEVVEVIDATLRDTMIARLGIVQRKADAQKLVDDANNSFANIKEQKRQAMRYGNVSDEDIKNAPLVKEQQKLLKDIEEKEQRRNKLREELDKLEKKELTGDTEKQIKDKEKQIKLLDEEIKSLEVLIDNRNKKKVLDQQEREARREEYFNKKAQTTPDKDKITSDKDKSDSDVSEGDPKITGAIKAGITGSVINIDKDGLATEETLNAILELLTSGDYQLPTKTSATNQDDEELDQVMNAISGVVEKVEQLDDRVTKAETDKSTKSSQKSTKKTQELPIALQNARKASSQYATLGDKIANQGFGGSSEWKAYQGVYKKLQEATAKAEAAIAKGHKPNANNLKNIQALSDKMLKLGQDVKVTIGEFDKLQGKIQKYKTIISDAKDNGYLFTDGDKQFVKAMNELNETIKKVQAGKASFEELGKAYRNALEAGSNVNKTINANKRLYAGTNEINSAKRQYDKIIGTSASVIDLESDEQPLIAKQYVDAYNALIAKHKEFADANKLSDPKIQEQLRQQAAGVQRLGKKLMFTVNEAQKLEDAVAHSGAYTDKNGQVHELGAKKLLSPEELKNVESSVKAYAQAVYGADLQNVKFDKTTKTLTGTIRQNDYVVSDVAVKYNAATGEVYAFEKAERESLSGIPAFLKGLKAKASAIIQYLASITSIYQVIGKLRQGIQYIREIDSALTELKKVTDETEETYEKFLDTAAKTAGKVGSTIKEIVSSTADWARLGYSLKDATTLAETTSILLNVSEFQSIEDATSALTSTLQAFSYTAEQSLDVVDVLNEVGKLVAHR